MTEPDTLLVKRLTGIIGLDQATRGGLPAGGATLVLGPSGSGKTILGLQVLACAVARGEGGVMLSFEESRTQLSRDAQSFRWGRGLLESKRCEIIDAQRVRRDEVSGAFDIDGLLAVLDHCARKVDGAWIVIDGIDQLLRLQQHNQTAIDQIEQINQWSEAKGFTVLLTGKQGQAGPGRYAGPGGQPAMAQPGMIQAGMTQADYLEGIEFMLSTVFLLGSTLQDQRLNRRFRIAKYRGTGHVTDELAMVMDDEGIHLPYGENLQLEGVQADTSRISTGIPRLDEVLGGGYYRGSTTLISGQPGTAKTTLAAAFAEAAASRGERVLFLSFDEFGVHIVRNVATVGIDLQPHLDSGQLKLHARAAWMSLVEEHYIDLLRIIRSFRPQCLVIDPASALLKSSDQERAYDGIERILAMTRATGITALLTSLTQNDDAVGETTLSHTSTLADTWIVLRYQIRGGERNRALSVVKSRGTAHSNQVRELIINSDGVDLADVYRFGSDVLMGTARLQKEEDEAADKRRIIQERAHRRQEVEQQIEDAQNRVRQAEADVVRLAAALDDDSLANQNTDQTNSDYLDTVQQRREFGRSGEQRPRTGHADRRSGEG